jgi:hypothetical protein
MFGFLTWLFDKIAGPVMRRLNHPSLDIERAEPAGSHMVDPMQVSVNVALTIRNTGRAAALWYGAVARVSRGDGARLTLRDPRNPGNASARQENDDDVIEWQSTELWPPEHTRRIECKVHLRQGMRVPITVMLRAPHMKAIQREVEVTWPEREPEIRFLG